MSETKKIGNKIAEARKRINISQAQLAERLFISSQAVGKWERGESMDTTPFPKKERPPFPPREPFLCGYNTMLSHYYRTYRVTPGTCLAFAVYPPETVINLFSDVG